MSYAGFSRVWGVARQTESALTEEEGQLLYRSALRADPGYAVEIGCYKGRGTLILAAAAAHRSDSALLAVTVDPFEPYQDDSAPMKPEKVKPADPEQIEQLLARHQLTARVHKAKSRDLAVCWPIASVSLLFIDGDHSPDGVRSDWLHWLPNLRRGALVAWHDYHSPGHAAGRWDGVCSVVDTLLDQESLLRLDLAGCLLLTQLA